MLYFHGSRKYRFYLVARAWCSARSWGFLLPKHHGAPKPVAVLGRPRKAMKVKQHTFFIKRKPINLIRFWLAESEKQDDCTPMTSFTQEVMEAGAGSILKGTNSGPFQGIGAGIWRGCWVLLGSRDLKCFVSLENYERFSDKLHWPLVGNSCSCWNATYSLHTKYCEGRSDSKPLTVLGHLLSPILNYQVLPGMRGSFKNETWLRILFHCLYEIFLSWKEVSRNDLIGEFILLRVIPTMAFCFTYILAFNLAYILTVYLSFYLAYILTFYLAFYLAFNLAYVLTFFLKYILIFFFWHFIWHSIWHIFWHFIWHSIWRRFWHSIWHSI